MEQVPVEAVCVLPKTETGTCPSSLHISCCNDALQELYTEAENFIAVYQYPQQIIMG